VRKQRNENENRHVTQKTNDYDVPFFMYVIPHGRFPPFLIVMWFLENDECLYEEKQFF
jgi:hypothetical protein